MQMLSTRYGVRRAGLTIPALEIGLLLLSPRVLHRLHMGCAGAMAAFAADGQFEEGGAIELSVASCHRVGPAAVAKNTSRCDGPVEAKIRELITGRRRPAVRLAIEGERRLKEMVVLLKDSPEAIHPGADDPFDSAGRLEGRFAVGPHSCFALVEISLLCVDFKAPVEPLVLNEAKVSV